MPQSQISFSAGAFASAWNHLSQLPTPNLYFENLLLGPLL